MTVLHLENIKEGIISNVNALINMKLKITHACKKSMKIEN